MLHTRGINGRVQDQVHFFSFHNLCNQKWQGRGQPFDIKHHLSCKNKNLSSKQSYCPGVLSRATLMFALIRSKSSAVVARGDGCRFLYMTGQNNSGLVRRFRGGGRTIYE
jgi:hypothetical protein